MKESPEGYSAYERVDFPPDIIRYGANFLALILIILAIFIYYPISPAAYVAVTIFGLSTAIFLHEGFHYLTHSWMGYEPIFEFPSKVYTPNEPFDVQEGIISLLAPQILTLLYLVFLQFQLPNQIEFMIILSLIINTVGGLRDVAWTLKRVSWPSGHIVLVDSEGKEYVAFIENS